MEKSVLDLRKKCITGTDIAAICGQSRWKTPLQVYAEKKGLADGILDNKFMEWGRRLESIVANKWEEDNGVKLTKGSFVCDGIFGGTPDFFTLEKLIEIKTTSLRNSHLWGEPGTDMIPDEYLCQVQWYMGLLDLDTCDLCVLIGGNDYRVYVIKRNLDLIKMMRNIATTWWKRYIINDEIPGATAEDNYSIKDMFPSHSNAMLDRPVYDEQAKVLYELREKRKELDKEIDHYEALFKQVIGDSAGVKGSCWKATWKRSSDIKKIDWPAVAKEAEISGNLIEKHTKIVEGSRRFLFTSNF